MMEPIEIAEQPPVRLTSNRVTHAIVAATVAWVGIGAGNFGFYSANTSPPVQRNSAIIRRTVNVMNAEIAASQPTGITTQQASVYPSVEPPIDSFFTLIPEETVAQAAARFRAFQAERLTDQVGYVDADIPFIDDGGDW